MNTDLSMYFVLPFLSIFLDEDTCSLSNLSGTNERVGIMDARKGVKGINVWFMALKGALTCKSSVGNVAI